MRVDDCAGWVALVPISADAASVHDCRDARGDLQQDCFEELKLASSTAYVVEMIPPPPALTRPSPFSRSSAPHAPADFSGC